MPQTRSRWRPRAHGTGSCRVAASRPPLAARSPGPRALRPAPRGDETASAEGPRRPAPLADLFAHATCRFARVTWRSSSAHVLQGIGHQSRRRCRICARAATRCMSRSARMYNFDGRPRTWAALPASRLKAVVSRPPVARRSRWNAASARDTPTGRCRLVAPDRLALADHPFVERRRTGSSRSAMASMSSVAGVMSFIDPFS